MFAGVPKPVFVSLFIILKERIQEPVITVPLESRCNKDLFSPQCLARLLPLSPFQQTHKWWCRADKWCQLGVLSSRGCCTAAFDTQLGARAPSTQCSCKGMGVRIAGGSWKKKKSRFVFQNKFWLDNCSCRSPAWIQFYLSLNTAIYLCSYFLLILWSQPCLHLFCPWVSL